MSYDIVVVSDAHHEPGVPEHPSYKAVTKFIHDIRPSKIVIIGDFADFMCFSQHHTKDRTLLTEGKRYHHTCQLATSKLRELARCCNDIYYLEGNHEYWATRYVQRHPEMEGYIDWQRDFCLNEFNIKVVPFNEVLTLGKTHYTHGWYINKYHTSKHLDAMGDHLFYGHTHDAQMAIRQVRAKREPYIAQSIGCLCDKNPSYMMNRPNRWVHGFLYVEVFDENFFTPHFMPIIRGAFSFGRNVWRGA